MGENLVFYVYKERGMFISCRFLNDDFYDIYRAMKNRRIQLKTFKKDIKETYRQLNKIINQENNNYNIIKNIYEKNEKNEKSKKYKYKALLDRIDLFYDEMINYLENVLEEYYDKFFLKINEKNKSSFCKSFIKNKKKEYKKFKLDFSDSRIVKVDNLKNMNVYEYIINPTFIDFIKKEKNNLVSVYRNDSILEYILTFFEELNKNQFINNFENKIRKWSSELITETYGFEKYRSFKRKEYIKRYFIGTYLKLLKCKKNFTIYDIMEIEGIKKNYAQTKTKILVFLNLIKR